MDTQIPTIPFIIVITATIFTLIVTYIVGYYVGYNKGYWDGIDHATIPKPKYKKPKWTIEL